MTDFITRRSHPSCTVLFCVALLLSDWGTSGPRAADDDASELASGDVTYEQQIEPIVRVYCGGCHNDTEAEGDFSVSSFGQLMKGSGEGAVVVPGNAAESSILQLIAGTLEPKMPPEDEPQPKAEEIELLRRWIEQGAARGTPAAAMPSREASVDLGSKIQPAAQRYVGAACGVGQDRLAVGGFRVIRLLDLSTGQPVWECRDLPGKVTQLRLSSDGTRLVASTGIAGATGEVLLLSASDGSVVQRFVGNDDLRHSDLVYCASLSPDGRWLASGSYDRRVILWDVDSGSPTRVLTGHNGTIYDLDFDPSGRGLVTASGDQTVKLWNVSSGERLDTFGQPEGEMLCVRFGKDGKYVYAAGADRQIRQWQIMSLDKPAINPMLAARFAHGAGIVQLQLIGDQVVSSSSDRSIKAWGAASLEPHGLVGKAADVPVALCRVGEVDAAVIVVDLLGDVRQLSLPAIHRAEQSASADRSGSELELPEEFPAPTEYVAEEPNDLPRNAIAVQLPAEIQGVIAPSNVIGEEDVDLFRIHAVAGQPWIFEVNAARSGSSLDSRIEILHVDGSPVLQTRLQAVRESYFTFRGKDSNTIDDFRLHKWEDMELDEYLYSSGEVVRLWLYPRGPDSGFKVYPGSGARHTYFDTTAVSHALGEPAYVVRELAAGVEPLPNGLPVFPIYFENDDDPLRRYGSDSRLQFTAPETGDYLVRVRDARGFGGEKYTYQLSIRPPRPDFQVTVNGPKLSIPVGTGREWSVSVTRMDGMNGPITIELDGLPAGIEATQPLVVEANQIQAVGTLFATDAAAELLTKVPDADGDSQALQASQTFQVGLRATSEYQGRTIEHELPTKLEVTVAPRAGLTLKIASSDESTRELSELTIRPGQTISARVILDRQGATGAISFGNEDSGRGLPHGAFVDNIGLNGLLIPDGQDEREFFITAAPKVIPGRFQFHLRCTSQGNPTSRPIWLNVLPVEP